MLVNSNVDRFAGDLSFNDERVEARRLERAPAVSDLRRRF